MRQPPHSESLEVQTQEQKRRVRSFTLSQNYNREKGRKNRIETYRVEINQKGTSNDTRQTNQLKTNSFKKSRL